MNPKPAKLNSYLIFLIFIPFAVSGQVRLPKLISDGMVLQRETNLKIWGWASSHEKVSIYFKDSLYETTTNDSGKWEVQLSNLKAGGPYVMRIQATNTILIKDILIGDVWVCSGQSNMELPMKRVSNIYQPEIENSENAYIRYFAVPQAYNFKVPQNDYESGKWQATNPKDLLSYSAVSYFFAKELYDKYRIPIGLINASLGGSPAEAWMSEESLQAFPEYYKEAQRFKDDSLISRIERIDRNKMQEWYNILRVNDEGYKDPDKIWSNPALSTSDWAVMQIPGYWATTEIGAANGVVWFRKEINIPAEMTGMPAQLILGRIVDADSVYINGFFIGATGYQYPPRRYDIPSTLLNKGKNTIVVRVINNAGNGGFVPDKPYELKAGGQFIDLKGNWQYRLGSRMEPSPGQTYVRWKPVGLYNSMISPLLNYRIKGVIWYQGESNAERPIEYRKLFPALIRDWRNKWNQGDFPFLFVQLANFMEEKSQPSESNWALLRESQLKTLSVTNTGMAVAIDIGEWNDIHPLNKKDVGKRLAIAAQKIAYNEANAVYSGPIYKSLQVEGSRIILNFESIGSGLIVKGGGKLKYFAIAGADKRFIWANARINHNRIVVWNDAIPDPSAVRYAWADNPQGANLYNKEGLPASPFRTDE